MTKHILFVAFLPVASCFASTVTVFFTVLPVAIQNGTYNGFATATVAGVPNQLLICDDYHDDTYMPSSSNLIYDFSTLGGSNPLQKAMFDAGSNAQVQLYEEAAVLVFGLAKSGPGASSNTVTDYQYALWNLMSPGVSFAQGRASQEMALQASALAALSDLSQQNLLNTDVFPNFRVYTPTAQFQGNQEFLQYLSPEPATGVLFGVLALVAGAGMKLRSYARRRAAKSM